MIVDPETGAGAYLIEGKGNGGEFLSGFAAFLGIVGGIGILAGFSLFLIVILAIGSIFSSLISYFMTAEPCGDERDNASLTLIISLTIASSILSIFGSAGHAIATAIIGWVYSSAVAPAIFGYCHFDFGK